MNDEQTRIRFKNLLLPLMNDTYNLARWLMKNPEGAEDMVQESYLRAFRFFASFHEGTNFRAWFLRIVRNTAFTLLQKERPHDADVEFDEELHTPQNAGGEAGARLDLQQDQETVRAAIDQLPPEFREVVTLRELEDCAYKEIADICNIPVGTVMSRLARARAQLQQILSQTYRKEN